MNFLNSETVWITTVNSYYDNSNRTNPIQFYVNSNYYFDITQDDYIGIQVDETKVNLIDGRKISVFEDGAMSRYKHKNGTSQSNRVGLIEFFFSPKYYEINERYNYQPVFSRDLEEKNNLIANSSNSKSFTKEFSGTSNSTESSTKEIEDRNEFYVFFVMAQIGGFYSFLKLVFGIFFSLISDKMTIMAMINSFRANKNYFRMNHIQDRKKKRKINPIKDIKQKRDSKLANHSEEVKLEDDRKLKDLDLLQMHRQRNVSVTKSAYIIKHDNLPKDKNDEIKRKTFRKSLFRSFKNDFRYEFMDIVYMTLCCYKPKTYEDTG